MRKRTKVILSMLLILVIALIATTMILGASAISRSDDTIERIDRKIEEAMRK